MLFATGLLLGGMMLAQTKPRIAAKPEASRPKAVERAPKPAQIAWRSHCSNVGDFCIDVPAHWELLGEIFDGAGFVVAEPDPKAPKDDWSQITAAAIDLPEPPPGKDEPDLDTLIDSVRGSPAKGVTAETERRTNELIADMQAEVVKVRLHDTKTSTDWIEEVAFLNSDELVYSVALRCAPEAFDRMDPIFRHALQSWKPAPTPVKPPPAPAHF